MQQATAGGVTPAGCGGDHHDDPCQATTRRRRIPSGMHDERIGIRIVFLSLRRQYEYEQYWEYA